MKILFPATLCASLALSACNSSNVLESMEGLDRGNLTTGSIQKEATRPDSRRIAIADKPASEATSANQDIALIEALSAGNEQTPAQKSIESLVEKPVAKPKRKPVQTASLRPQKVRRTSSTHFNNIKVYKARFGDAKPIDFGRASPKYFQVHGVDVSRWQYDINWKTLRGRGGNFAFIKATEGGDHLDPMFAKNWNAAAKAGVPRGAYHFFYWCRVAEQQADWFIQNVPKVKGALPPVLDVEWNNHSKTCPKRPSRKVVLAKMRVFLKKVEKHYGQKPIIYTAPDFYEDNLRGQFKDYPFWLRSVAAHPKKRYPNRKWIFWQYSGTGLSKGVDTQIDLNVFNGSQKAWRNWLAKNIR